MEFRCTAHQHVFDRGYIGLFWANYINAPDDKGIYFRRGGNWLQLCTQEHNNQSTVRHVADSFEPSFAADFGTALFNQMSPLRYDEPFFYGNFREMTAIWMFDRTRNLRFAHSPSGGGHNPDRSTTNPAWDFHYYIPDYDVNTEYGFKARLVYRPKCAREEILREFQQWKAR
jgi:hypothetical protein